jgi:alkylation response protein AidB-like acyl-CoA dehydrogenase
MTEYKVDIEDVKFTLFDFLQAANLAALPRYREQGRETYEAVLDEALKFARNEIAPLNERGDREGVTIVDGVARLPSGFREALRRFGDAGFIASDLDPAYGGMGLPTLIHTAAAEFSMGACAAFAAFQLLTHGAANLIAACGSEEQKLRFLSRLAAGKDTGTMCLTEVQAGSAIGDITTSARLSADGSYAISGTKMFITGGSHDLTDNIVHLVLARAAGDPPGTRGLSLFIVPKRRVSSEGLPAGDNDVRLISVEHKLGVHASPTCMLIFGEQDHCQGWLVGARGDGMKHMFRMMNEARLAVGQQGVALGGAAYEHALAYARGRVQGRNTEIIQYPDVRRLLMTMKAYVEGLRCLVLEAALFVDLALHHPDQAVRDEHEGHLGLMTPVCKAFGSDMGFRVTEMAVQVYGGYGYLQDFPAEQYLRDLKAASLYEGTNGVQALDLVGRKVLRDRGERLGRYLDRIRGEVAAAGQNPELADLASKVQGTLLRFGKAAELLAVRAQENAQAAELAATPFLRALGDILCAQLLVRRAAVAGKQLAALGPSHPPRFLLAKQEVARFYVEQILPDAEANLARVITQDRSALADVL